jgi:hypothetical protein
MPLLWWTRCCRITRLVLCTATCHLPTSTLLNLGHMSVAAAIRSGDGVQDRMLVDERYPRVLGPSRETLLPEHQNVLFAERNRVANASEHGGQLYI